MHARSHVKVPSETYRRRSAGGGILGMLRVQIRGDTQETALGAAAGSPRLGGAVSWGKAERRRLAGRQLASTTRDRTRVCCTAPLLVTPPVLLTGCIKTAVVRLNVR